MQHNNKAQLSIETMIIYGLVFLVALSVVGGLLYFDILNVGSYLPEECDLGTGDLSCEEWALSSNSDTFEIGVRNTGQRTINDIEITVTDVEEGVFTSERTLDGVGSLSPGELEAFTVSAEGLEQGDVLRGDILVTYTYGGGVVDQESLGSIRISAS